MATSDSGRPMRVRLDPSTGRSLGVWVYTETYLPVPPNDHRQLPCPTDCGDEYAANRPKKQKLESNPQTPIDMETPSIDWAAIGQQFGITVAAVIVALLILQQVQK